MFIRHGVILVVHLSCVVVLGAAAAAADGNAVPESGGGTPAAKVVGAYTLPDTPLASVERYIKNDRGILLGSIGSDLWHDPSDPPNRFWMTTDRGPNGKVEVEGRKRRTFPMPEFTPLFLHVEVRDAQIRILKAVPILDSHGAPVSGISNIKGHDEAPYNFDGRRQLPYNPNGLDIEGLVRTARGDFWAAEEYSPSLVHCDAGGRVLKRFIPAGLKLSGTGYPLAASLPGIFARRRKNRGFEGLTLGRDRKTLYAVLQSPLLNPDEHAAAHSRNVRLLAFDIAEERPVGEYVYQLEKPAAAVVSGMAMLSDAALLVLERSDDGAWLYKVDLARATNILGGKWDDVSTSPASRSGKRSGGRGRQSAVETIGRGSVEIAGRPQKGRRHRGARRPDNRRRQRQRFRHRPVRRRRPESRRRRQESALCDSTRFAVVLKAVNKCSDG